MVVPSLESIGPALEVIRTTASAAGTTQAGSNFADFTAKAIAGALGTVPAAEKAAVQGIAGGKPSHQVVMSILEAERNLQTVLAIRDKVVAAYQEISRMPV